MPTPSLSARYVPSTTPAGGTFTYRANDGSGEFVINRKSPTGVPQSLKPFEDAIANLADVKEAILLVSPLDDSIYAVVEMSAGTTTSVGGEIESVNISFESRSRHG